jgi:hypothetical protein
MRRFLRILLNAATALCLLLSLATALLWLRSRYHFDQIAYARNDVARLRRSTIALESGGGRLFAIYWISDYTLTTRATEVIRNRGLPPNVGLLFTTTRAPDWPTSGSGFEAWRHTRMTGIDSSSALGAPHWAVVIAFAILPSIRILKIGRRRRRTTNGRCPTCGYDLRATPDRCPECGATPTSTKKTAAQQAGTAALQKT